MTVCGTPWIMAPELLQSKPYGSPADVFSYGILLCEIVIRCKTDDIPRTNDFGVDINEVKKLNTNKFSEKFLNLVEAVLILCFIYSVLNLNQRKDHLLRRSFQCLMIFIKNIPICNN